MMLPSQFGPIVQPRGALRMDEGGDVGTTPAPLVRGQGPRPAWWPEDRPWAPGDVGYGGGQIKPMLPTQPGMLGALGAFDMAQPYPAPGVSGPSLPEPAQPFPQPWEGGGGGGGGMAVGGAVRRRFEEGGDVGDSGSQGERDNTEGGDMTGALGGGQKSSSAMDAEHGFTGAPPSLGDKISDFLDRNLAQAMLGALPAGGLAGLIGRGLANFADRNELSRDNATPGVGGTAGPFGGSGGEAPGGAVAAGREGGGPGNYTYTNDQFAADRAAPIVAAVPGALTAPALRLPALQQPTFDPRTYGFGPAAAWLR